MNTGPQSAGADAGRGETPDTGGSEPAEPSERLQTCARPTCDTDCDPYRPNQKYCSDNCRKRAYEERRRRRMARHVARELLDPERIEAAIASFENDE